MWEAAVHVHRSDTCKGLSELETLVTMYGVFGIKKKIRNYLAINYKIRLPRKHFRSPRKLNKNVQYEKRQICMSNS